MHHGVRQQRKRHFQVAERVLLVAIGSEPGRDHDRGAQFSAGPERKSPSKRELVCVQPKGHQECAGGGVRLGGVA